MEGKVIIFALVVLLVLITQGSGMGQSAFCLDFEDCKPACGTGITRIKCHQEGYCGCVGQFIPGDVCGELTEKDRMCRQYCEKHPKSVAKKCLTERGKICSCFTYSAH